MNIDALINLITYLTKTIEDDYVKLKLKFFHKKSYHFVASNKRHIRQFIDILDSEGIKKDDKILDAGCGVSPIILILDVLGYTNIHGIDIFQPYLNKLDSLLITEVNLSKIDMFDYDYSDCKVVYSFVPINDEEEMVSFYKKVLNEIPVNGILIDYSGEQIFKKMNKYISTVENKEFEFIETGVIKRLN